MNIHVDLINNHPINDYLKIFETTLESVEKIKDKPEQHIEYVSLIRYVFVNFKESMDSCDKKLLSLNWLNDTQKALININTNLSNYISNKNINSLSSNIQVNLDNLLRTSSLMNTVKNEPQVKHISAVINKYHKAVDSIIDETTNKTFFFKNEIEDIKKGITEIDYSAKKKIEELSNSIKNEKERLDQLHSTYSSIFIEQEKALSINIDNLKEIFKTETHTFINKTDQKFEDLRERTKKIINLIDENVLSHKYREVANNARNRAIIWQFFALASMSVVAYIAYNFLITVLTEITWPILVARIVTIGTLLTISGYAISQSNKQERFERFARKIEMEMVSVDAFLESLEKEQRDALKAEIARNIFIDSNIVATIGIDDGLKLPILETCKNLLSNKKDTTSIE